MSEKMNDYQKKIEEEMERELAEIESELAMHPEITALEADDSIKAKIDEKIDAAEYEKVISQLPEEYREDFRRGKELREEREARANRRKLAYWKRLVAAAAVVVLVVGAGVTSVGGPKRAVELLQVTFAGRELDTVTATSDENALLLEESEESLAYQQIKEGLGIEPVRFVPGCAEIIFKNAEVDLYLQTANIIYEYNGRNISYVIQCFYTDGAWGTDMEDEQIDEYSYELNKAVATVKEYQLPESGLKKYAARFEYKEVEYQLVATMEKKEFEKLLDSLHFL